MQIRLTIKALDMRDAIGPLAERLQRLQRFALKRCGIEIESVRDRDSNEVLYDSDNPPPASAGGDF